MSGSRGLALPNSKGHWEAKQCIERRLTRDLDSSEMDVWVTLSWKEPHQELRANGTQGEKKKKKIILKK